MGLRDFIDSENGQLVSRLASITGAIVFVCAPFIGGFLWTDYTGFKTTVLRELGGINTTLAAAAERGNALRQNDIQIGQRLDRLERRVDQATR